MKPVWIKYYGLIPMTKWGYLIALITAGAVVSLMILMAAVAGLLPPLDTMWSRRHHVPSSNTGAWLYNYCYWLLLVCLVAQAIDTLITLRTFARKEAEQRAQLDAEWERLGEGRPRTPGVPETHVKGGERRPPDEHLRPRG
jgi:hypothetical protein